jgi:hypothetical protein
LILVNFLTILQNSNYFSPINFFDIFLFINQIYNKMIYFSLLNNSSIYFLNNCSFFFNINYLYSTFELNFKRFFFFDINNFIVYYKKNFFFSILTLFFNAIEGLFFNILYFFNFTYDLFTLLIKIFFTNKTFFLFYHLYDFVYIYYNFYINFNNYNTIYIKKNFFKSNFFFDNSLKTFLTNQNEESNIYSRNLKFNNPVFKYDYKSGDYFPKLYKEFYAHLFSSILDLTSGLRTSS